MDPRFLPLDADLLLNPDRDFSFSDLVFPWCGLLWQPLTATSRRRRGERGAVASQDTSGAAPWTAHRVLVLLEPKRAKRREERIRSEEGERRERERRKNGERGAPRWESVER
jgi:hypothetical protein